MLFLAKAAIGASATLALAGAWVFHEGVIRVDVDEARSGGSHVHFWVPATTVSTGLRLTPRHYLRQAADKSRDYLPVLRELAKELQKYPNAELLDVRDASNHVHVSVKGGKLYLDAVSDNEDIHISCPTVTLEDVADRLEDAAPGV
jgi:hypothetical protein